MPGIEKHRLNAPGDFYVVDDCCITCGIPQELAPDLFGAEETEESYHCYVRRQPADQQEVHAMIKTINAAEAECIRYGGSDREVQASLAELGEGGQCDQLPADLEALSREVRSQPSTGARILWLSRVLERFCGRAPS